MARILVVDDEAYIRDVLGKMLRRAGHDVDHASDGEEACRRVAAREYDLIITDVRMPRMDGIEFLRKVQRQVESTTPCMILTAFGETDYAIEATRLGVCNFLVKPFEMPDLVVAVDRALDVREAWTFRREYQAGLENKIRDIVDAFTSNLLGLVHDIAETKQHTERLAARAVLLAKRMGHDGDGFLRDLRLGALLHDLGKIKVGRSILTKNTTLTEEDWQVIRQHPSWGAEIVRGIPLLENATKVILCHHERFDGRGYPHGLRGEKIPLEARIFAVVDAYDCMTERRAYKAAFSPEFARQEIENGAGTQFDPLVVRAFLENFDEIRAQFASTDEGVPVQIDVAPDIRSLAEAARVNMTAHVAEATAARVRRSQHPR